jgi:hypothetical protein
MMMKRLLKVVLVLGLCAGLSSCEEPRIYGSVGFSNWSGGYGGGMGTSVSIGGRIR